MKKLILVLLLPISILISGCEGEVHYVATSDTPELQGFYVIDSDGVSSEFYPHQTSIIDPYTNEGIFEVYWYANSFYDYHAYLSINDRPGVRGAILINSDLCGPGFPCDYDGSFVCEYTSNFYMGCGLDLYEAERNFVRVDSLIADIPDRLYLNFEVCDRFDNYCEIDSVPIELY